MSTRNVRVALIALFSALLALVCTVGAADASQAATTYSTSSAYTIGWTVRSTDLKKCARVTVEGYVEGSWRYLYNNGDLNDLRWTKLRLVDPKVNVAGWGYTSTGCDSSKHWSVKAKITQAWYEYNCSLNVIKSLSVGVPWSISAELAPPTCGSSRAGHRASTEGPSSSGVTQFNSGAPISFSDTNATVGARRTAPNGGLDFTGAIAITLISSAGSDPQPVHHVKVNLNK